MARLLGLLVPVLMALIAVPTRATTIHYSDLRESVDFASIVATGEIVSKSAIKFDGSSTDICGYVIHARIKTAFKPISTSDISYFSSTDLDILQDYKEYFFLLYSRGRPDAETMLGGRNCDTRGIKYAVDGNIQTVFPIETAEPHQSPDYLLVGRRSPFFTTNFLVCTDKYIHLFALRNERIYGLAPWMEVISDVKEWIAHPRSDQSE